MLEEFWRKWGVRLRLERNSRAYNYVGTIDERTTLSVLESRLKTVEDYWQQYMTIEDDLGEFDEDEIRAERDVGEETGALMESFEQVEVKYLMVHASLSEAIRSRKHTEPINESADAIDRLATQQNNFMQQMSNLSVKNSEVALPKIVIPAFSGDYSKWTAFRDLFVGSVDCKAKLTQTQKFYYLTSFLAGEAADLIKNIPISDEHYKEAWGKLNARYNRPHLVACAYIKRFLKLPTASTANAKILRQIIDGADECLRGLKAIQLVGRDPWLIHLLLSKMDLETRNAWYEEVGSRIDLKVDNFLEFLDKRFTHLESNDMLAASTSHRQTTIRSHLSETSSQSCLKCKSQHVISQCPEFISLDIDARRKFTQLHSLCFNCLKKGHVVSRCNSNFRCRVCNARHHTLVHSSPSVSPRSSGNATNRIASNTSSLIEPSNSNVTYRAAAGEFVASNHITSCLERSTVVMPTAIVRVKNQSGQFVYLRALIDSGSQVSFVTEKGVQKIGVRRSHARLSIKGVASADGGITKGVVSLTLQSCINDCMVNIQAYILDRITVDMPIQEIAIDAWNSITHLHLADPKFNVIGPIDLLLGSDVVWSIFTNGKINVEDNRLFAINSIFGWIIGGQCDIISSPLNVAAYTVSVDVDQLLQRFWELDERNTSTSTFELSDPAEEHFRSTFSQSSDGKYIVELPFSVENPQFDNTLAGAVSRLHSMERRFARDSELKRLYTQFMEEYEALGHMEIIPSDEITKLPQFYLPHHAVRKPDSSTTKLRVVFDGSFKDSLGISLNDTLLIGPSIQRDLFGVSIRFREFGYAFTADIVKMFRQIWIAKHNRDYQRIVWRNSTDQPIAHYRLRTVTYGTASAPFLSVRVLQQLAMDHKQTHPRAASIILNNIYVDDIMAGAETIQELTKVQTELVELLNQGGFTLAKWGSNSPEFLSKIQVEAEMLVATSDNSSESCIKVLGVYWNPMSDTYSFRVTGWKSCRITKRHILSEVARIFDVFGFLEPAIVVMKILFQKLWLLKITWDEELPNDIAWEWKQIRAAFHYFERINIPRRICTRSSEVELHCFCDASTLAYAAVIYCVSRHGDSATSINIIAAKSRVAPLKSVSIPRLELCAALLLTRLFTTIKHSLNISDPRIFAWTDSMIVLHWLSAAPRNWKIFVSHRTDEILSTIPRNCWDFVSTHDNPADCASRGLKPKELVDHELWWTGPPWLSWPREHWPKPKFNAGIRSYDTDLERRNPITCAALPDISRSGWLELSDRISSWDRLLKISCYVLRAIDGFRRRSNFRLGCVSFDELHRARNIILRSSQQESFKDTIKDLISNRVLKSKNTLIKLAPFVDSIGLLRVGGRIQNASAPFNIKHPIIIQRNHISELIVKNMHETYLHVGAAELFIILRQHFWVFGARNLVRSTVFKCKICFMLRRKTSSQLMASLPNVRVLQSRPFLNSGCDFAGPIMIKMTNCKRPRICKAYICIFVCMSVKAIHLELVGSLTSEAFIAAFKRFVSRRGKCSNLYSDNGTNFQGARRIMNEMRRCLQDQTNNEDITVSLAKDGTSWHFIPPSSPHFGGLWESGVKSVKLHLRRVIGEAILSYEEVYTVLTQIEAILNSRPLCSTSDIEFDPLTPSHFLIGEPLTAVPEPCRLAEPMSRLNHWNYLQNMVQGFWKRWSAEYLTSLQQRPKWQQPQRSFQVDDVVVLKDLNLPQCKWLIGRIASVQPGSDGLVRVATIRTKTGIYKRPITKLALLPVS